jgi:ABC-2 type transport system permease protein
VTTTTSVGKQADVPEPREADTAALEAALVAGDRPPRPSPLTAAGTFGWRALLKIKHVPEQLFDVTIFPILMTLMFTYLFGGALAGSVDAYVQFFLPGILVSTVVMITMYTGVTINTDIEKGVFDRFRSLPVWRPAALMGALLGDAVRFTLASLIVVGVGLAIGFRPDGGVGGVALGILLILVFSFSIGWAWTLLGLILRTPQSVMGTSMMVLFPLTFISNIFVDPSTMPGWLEAFVDINPISHLVTAVRGAMHGGIEGGDILAVLLWSAAFIAVFGPLTMRRYTRRN